jgi:hypothetical protein
VDDLSVCEVGPPDAGSLEPCRARVGLTVTQPAGVAVERRRGWTEAAGTPPRPAGDMWDEARGERVIMEKARPGAGGRMRLRVRGHYAAFRAPAPGLIEYDRVEDDEVIALEDVHWADWAADGRLLMPTPAHADLATLAPDPAPASAEALEW